MPSVGSTLKNRAASTRVDIRSPAAAGLLARVPIIAVRPGSRAGLLRAEPAKSFDAVIDGALSFGIWRREPGHTYRLLRIPDQACWRTRLAQSGVDLIRSGTPS